MLFILAIFIYLVYDSISCIYNIYIHIYIYIYCVLASISLEMCHSRSTSEHRAAIEDGVWNGIPRWGQPGGQTLQAMGKGDFTM